MSSQRPRLFLVDGFSNIFRAYFAIRGLTNSQGVPTNATYGFLQMLRKLLRDEEPELIGVAWDLGEPTVRSERYAAYKAHRPEMPEDLRPQLPWVRRTLEALRIPILEYEGYEADDVLGTLSRKAEAAGYDVVLVSADKDLMQLVTDHVRMLHTGRDKVYGPEEVEADFGVPPARVVDVLALMGDTADNVPGVKGIGQKGAVQLIKDFGSLDDLLARTDEVPRKSYREGLQTHREDAEMSRELVTIHCDLPVDFDTEGLRHDPPDGEALAALAAELEFRSLLEELRGKTAAAASDEGAALVDAETAERFRESADAVGGRLTLLWVERNGLTGLAVGGGEGEGVWADLRRDGLAPAVKGWLAQRMADPKTELICHDLKPIHRLVALDGDPACATFDTMLAAYLLRPAAHGFSLAEAALDRLQLTLAAPDAAGFGKDGEAPPPGDPRLPAWAGGRLAATRRLAEAMVPELAAEAGMTRVYQEIEAPLTPVLMRMERHGIRLDSAHLRRLSEEFGREMGELERQIFDEAGHELNLNSPRQLGEVLFEELGYPVLRKTRKTKSYSTDAATLEELATRGFPLPRLLLRYRELSKLKSTYVDALPEVVQEDGRLHTEYVQVGSATGRLASTNPNLQNIPVRTEDGRRIRQAFVAPKGYRLLVADYSQIELRVLAHIAQEPALIEAFREELDIHAATAAAVLGVDPGLITPDQRRAAKVVNFGILYGMSAFGLANNLGIPQAEAKKFIDTYMARYPRVQEYIRTTIERAESTGRVETLYGRIRWIPELTAKSPPVRDNGRRIAINAPIQGTAADLLKLAMIAVDRRLRAEHPDAALLLTVHDELVLEVPEKELDAVTALVTEEMQGVAELAVPLVVETGAGRSWYEAKE
ncbi:MAG: DNA polymerase I [Thermoanaerobaculia bacterium]